MIDNVTYSKIHKRTIEITDAWGVLKVEKGGFIDTKNREYALVTKPLELDNKTINGDGWTLELNDGWKIESVADKFQLIKSE